jgi:hypothetical protein
MDGRSTRDQSEVDSNLVGIPRRIGLDGTDRRLVFGCAVASILLFCLPPIQASYEEGERPLGQVVTCEIQVEAMLELAVKKELDDVPSTPSRGAGATSSAASGPTS